MAASSAARRESWRVEQVRAALGGIANLYTHRAMTTGRTGFSVETEYGFASSEVSRDSILREIGFCTGAIPAICEAFLAGLAAGLTRVFEKNAWQRAELRGLGVITPVQPKLGRFQLHHEQPLARFLKN